MRKMKNEANSTEGWQRWVRFVIFCCVGCDAARRTICLSFGRSIHSNEITPVDVPIVGLRWCKSLRGDGREFS